MAMHSRQGRLAPITETAFEAIEPAMWIPRRWGNYDPLKDEQGNRIAYNMRTKSLSQIIRERGMDPETVWAEMAADKQRLDALDINPTLSTEFTLEETEAPTDAE